MKELIQQWLNQPKLSDDEIEVMMKSKCALGHS